MAVRSAKLSELVERPESGRVFTESARPGLADCAPSGRVRLDALARFTQDIAYADAVEAGLSKTAQWVVRRTRMRVESFPRFGRPLELATFCSGLGPHVGRAADQHRQRRRRLGSRSSRYGYTWTRSPGGRRRCAKTSWPCGASPPEGERSAPDSTIPVLTGRSDAFEWRFRGTECDLAGHINNAAYFLPLEEELVQDDDPASIDVEIEYRSPAQPGEQALLRHGARRWIISPDGETHASLIVVNRERKTLNAAARS